MSGNNVTLQRNLQIQGFDAIRATGAIVIVFYHYGLVAQLLEGHMYPLHYTPVRYIWNSQENRTPNMPDYATCVCADSHCIRLTSGGR